MPIPFVTFIINRIHNFYNANYPEYSSYNLGYREQVKDSILIALNEKGSISWSELYKEMQKLYKKIAFETFNSCLKELRLNKLIDRTDVKERGKKVDYFLTNMGKQYVKLLLPDHETGRNTLERIENRRNMFLLLFLFRGAPGYIIESEKKLEAFLSENKLTIKSLIEKFKGEENKDGRTIIKTVFKPISGISIVKFETLDNGIVSEDKKITYRASLPGLSVTDILESRNKPAFWHIKFTREEVEDAFKLLLNESMLKPITIMYNGELRYVISDSLLAEFLDDCWHLYHKVYEMTDVVWTRIRKPTNDEIKSLELIRGTQIADRVRRDAYYARHKFFMRFKNKELVIKKASKKIREYNNNLTEDAIFLEEQYEELIEKYQFPCKDLLELIYPKFLRQISLNT